MTHDVRPAILIAEPDSEIRSMLVAAASRYTDCRILSAATGERAAELLRDGGVHAVLLSADIRDVAPLAGSAPVFILDWTNERHVAATRVLRAPFPLAETFSAIAAEAWRHKGG